MIQTEQRVDITWFYIVPMKKRFSHLQHGAGTNALSFDELGGILIHH